MTSSDNMKRHWGEGVDTVMGVDEAATGHHLYDTTGAKQHDSLLLSDSGRGYSTPSHAKQTIRKRALRRAHKRLNTNGFTWYRGQLWTSAPSFITEAQPTPSNDTPRWTLTTQPCEHVPRRRLQILHWNAGALSRSKYQEILHWCSINWIDTGLWMKSGSQTDFTLYILDSPLHNPLTGPRELWWQSPRSCVKPIKLLGHQYTPEDYFIAKYIANPGLLTSLVYINMFGLAV